MASPTQWTWAWASSGSWWWTGKPGMLQSMGSQKVGLQLKYNSCFRKVHSKVRRYCSHLLMWMFQQGGSYDAAERCRVRCSLWGDRWTLAAGQPRWIAWLGLDRGRFLHHSVSGRMREEYFISRFGESHFNNSTIFLDTAYIPKFSHCFSSPQKSNDLLSDSGCRLLVLCRIRYVISECFFLPGSAVTGVHRFWETQSQGQRESVFQSHPPGIALSFLLRQPVLSGQIQGRGAY